MGSDRFSIMNCSSRFLIVLRHNVNTNEMASFVLEDTGDDHVRSRDIVFHRHSDTSPTFVHVNNAMYDTLQYPLLHPFGGGTWSPGCRINARKITLAQYTKIFALARSTPEITTLGSVDGRNIA